MTSADPTLFSGTAAYYARYRPSYAPELIDDLTAEFRLDPAATVLDLGCGTGQLALPLSRRCGAVWAVDPDPDMLGEGVRSQADGGFGAVRWVWGRGEDVAGATGAASLPPIRLCTMGASFHWMDRDVVLRQLDRVVTPDGGVALVSGATSVFSRTASVEGVWLTPTREVIEQFLGPHRRAGNGTYRHPARAHEDVLRDSAFDQLQIRRFTSVRQLSVDEVVGQQLSTSYASPALLRERLAAFREELSRRLAELDDGTGFATTEHTTLVVARRGPAARGGG